MSQKVYVLRRKNTKIKPVPIPESTYRPPSARKPKKVDPITTPEYFIDLSRPKPVFEANEELKIPTYTNPPPTFEPVDFRVTHSQLQRDDFLIDQREKRIAEEKAVEPTEFFEWKQKMDDKDEEERIETIKRRHLELDNCRKKAQKAKKELIEKQLNDGTEIRENIRRQLEKTKEEIENERETIRQLKREMVDDGPAAVAKVQKANRETTREMKQKLNEDLKLLRRRINDELNQKKESAEKVREKARNHEATIRGKYTNKVDITDTRFLADLTDEETREIIDNNKAERRKYIESLIEKHRAAKEAKLDKMIELLNKESEYREQQEIEHERKRQEKKEKEAKEAEKKAEEEAAKMLILEKKLEKKRKQRIKEAEEMEEHMRTIQARNRYLALGKKAQAEFSFQSKQDGNLRTAKERQASMLKDDRSPPKTARRQKVAPELTNLKGMLGL